MTDTIIVALISAVVSFVVSLVATTLKNQADLARVVKEQEHGYAKALFDKRVEYYPELYNYLSGYGKIIKSKNQTAESLAEFKSRVDDWNSRYSLFFTNTTSRFSSKFRYFLGTMLSSNTIDSPEDWESIRKLIGYFENFLKAEIGIYAARPAGNVDEFGHAHKFIDGLIERSNQNAASPKQLK